MGLHSAYADPTMTANTAFEHEQNVGLLGAIELRGIVKFRGQWQISLKDSETGEMFWLYPGKQRHGLTLLSVDGDKNTVKLRAGDHIHEIEIVEAEASLGFFPTLAVLSPYNSKLLKNHRQLVKLKESQKTGRMLRNHTAQEALKKYLLTNPSAGEISNLVASLPDIYDLDKFLTIEFEGVHGRSKQDTAGWGVSKDLDFSELQNAIRRGASAEEIDKILRPKNAST